MTLGDPPSLITFLRILPSVHISHTHIVIPSLQSYMVINWAGWSPLCFESGRNLKRVTDYSYLLHPPIICYVSYMETQCWKTFVHVPVFYTHQEAWSYILHTIIIGYLMAPKLFLIYAKNFLNSFLRKRNPTSIGLHSSFIPITFHSAVQSHMYFHRQLHSCHLFPRPHMPFGRIDLCSDRVPSPSHTS